MSFVIPCTGCGKQFTVADDLAGRAIRCQTCGSIRRIPTRVSQAPQGPADTYPLAPEPLPDHDVPRRDGPVSTTNDPIRARGPAARQAAFQHGWRHSIRTNIGGSSRLESENLGLILLSLADLLVTYFLLRRGPAFYESNPVAQWFFVRWNIAGMAVFKLSAMGLVVVIGEIVERQRPGWGRGLLLVSCLATLVVVFHGLRLLLGHGDDGTPFP